MWETWLTDAPDDCVINPPAIPQPDYGTTGTYLDSYSGRDGVIALTGDSQLWFNVPNFIDGPYKQLQVQITRSVEDPVFRGPWATIEVELPGGIVPTPRFDDPVDHLDGWITEIMTVDFEPGPAWETVKVSFVEFFGEPAYPAYVCEVVIDTLCPEPGTMSLLALGGLAVLRRRRRG